MTDGARPRATYRLQFSPSFGFRDAAALAPFLAKLGVSHVYASPFFAARPGSTHGYDVVDHTRLNPELGDEADFTAMSEAFRRHGLGMIADFVPNHMGVGGAANRFWLSVLEWGQASPYAHWFDIDWAAPVHGLTGKVLAPFLGGAYGEILASGGLELRADRVAGELAVWAHDTHKLPVRPADYADVLARAPRATALAARFAELGFAAPEDARWAALRAELSSAIAAGDLDDALGAFRAGDPDGRAALDALIARQHWRAAKFTLDADAINYRRFFTISELAGLRVEDPCVFDAIHGLLLDLIARGVIDGVRIDHIDGLRDPKAYVLRLRAAAARPIYLLVEKILARDEALPADWDVDGTTGYEVGNLLAGLLTNPAATEALGACYAEFTGRSIDAGDVVRGAKTEIMTGPMAAEIEGLARRLHGLAQADPATRDLGLPSLRRGLVLVLAEFDVYRTYADAGGMGPADRARVAAAVGRARSRTLGVDPVLFEFIEAALTLGLPEGGAAMLEVALRAQQVSGPVMAKGLEDTALYRYNRLIALNEVGSEPGRFGVSVAEFHEANAQRLAQTPLCMLATSTHDTKRGEDARMRIGAISWDVALWRSSVRSFRALLAPADGSRIAPDDEYFFYQLLLGAWPADWPTDAPPPADGLAALRPRVQAAMLKSVREAARDTRWIFGSEPYERTLEGFIDHALDPARGADFLAAFGAMAATLGAVGAANALVQTVLKLTIPGVPDIYQGAEFWEQSLVDPDNRRAVDFAAREAALAAGPPDPAAPFRAHDKLAVTARLLALRRTRPRLFADGAYRPVGIDGADAGRACAFLRVHAEGTLLVAAAFGWTGHALAIGGDLDSILAAPGWTDVLAQGSGSPSSAPALFARLPMCALWREGALPD